MIHLDNFEQQYQNGESMNEIMNQVAEQCMQYRLTEGIFLIMMR